jgi:gluconokinase
MSTAASRPVSEPAAFVVMGVSGCGKSSVGIEIARHLGLEFIEGDTLHPEANIAKMSQGTPLTDEDRFPWLDRIGDGIAHALGSGRGVVVTCSALKRVYRDRLRAAAEGRLHFVYLKGDRELLGARMAARQGHFMPASLLDSQFATLEDPSTETNVITIDIKGSTADVIAAALEEIRNISRVRRVREE